MDRPRNYHSKTDRQRQISCDITYMWNLKCDTFTYLQTRNRFTDIENTLVVAKRDRGTEGMSCEFGVSRCKLLYTGRINKKSLL